MSKAISFTDPAWQLDRRPQAYDRLRQEAPVHVDPVTGNHVLTRYADVRAALIDFKSFSNDAGLVGLRESPVRDTINQMYRDKGFCPVRDLQSYDPPEHRTHRAPIDRAFDHWNVQAIGDLIRDTAHSIIDRFVERGEVEFVSEFAIPFPLHVFADQLGTAPEDALKLKQWSDVSVEEINPELSPEREIEIAHILIGMKEYFRDVLERTRANPDDRLISKLVQTTDAQGNPLDEVELQMLIRAVVVAAGDTTTFALGNAIRLLIDNPAIGPEIRDDPDKIASFVEETLRIGSPVQTLFRRATRDVAIGDSVIPAGALVEVRYSAANLDPATFACPQQIDLSRSNGRAHVAFGTGIHICIGMQLARAELNLGLQALLARIENLRPARGEESIVLSPAYIVNGPIALHLAFDKRSGAA
jgi:cytochrome P450